MAGGEEDIVIMGPGTAGYADARFSGRDSYAWVYGVDMESGRAVPTTYTRVLAQTTFSPVAFMSEWENASGDPILIWTGGDTAGNATIFEWENGTLSTKTQNQPAYTGGIKSRYDQDTTGGVDADEEMMFFCNGYAADVIIRRKKDGTVDGGGADGGATHTAKADLLAVVGSDVYRVERQYKLGILTDQTDPGIVGNYPTDAGSTPAGSPSYPINAVLALGASPHVVTGIGLFKYSTAPVSPVFNNVLEFRSPHPDNGKHSITDGRGRIYVVARNELIVVTFGFQQTHTPIKGKTIDRSTPTGDISAMAVDITNVYLAYEPGTSARSQDGMGLYVQEEDNNVFVNHTAVVTDRKWNGEADISNLTATDDYLLFGATQPFMGAYIELAGKRGSETSASALTVEYSSGNDAWTSATIMDSTLAFTQDGLISFHNSFQHPFDHSTPWTNTGASGSDTNSIDRYWMRIKPGSTLTGVTIRAVHLLPYRPPVAPDGNNATDATRMSGYKQAGALPTILKGHWQGEKLVWHDWQTLWTSKIEAMVIGRVNDGVTDSESALYAVTHDGLYAMAIGPDGDPATSAYSNLGDADTLAAGVNDHMACSSQYNFGVPTTVDQVLIGGDGLQSVDQFYVYTHMEHQPQWTPHGPFSHFPVVAKNIGTGKTLQVAWAFKDGSRTAIAPYVENIVVPKGQWRSTDEYFDDGAEQNVQTPQLM